jgi:hypothetical protein
MGLIMSEDNVRAETGPGHSGKANSWRRHLPYLLVLALALAGVAYANMSQKSLVAVSWVKQSMLFVILAGAFVAGIGMTFWSSRKES